MGCDDCLATALRARLGRCPLCAIQTLVIGLVGWLVWWWCGADTSVNALTGLLFALGAAACCCCIWRCLSGEKRRGASWMMNEFFLFQQDKSQWRFR